MVYQLKRKLPLAKALRRTARREIAGALRDLQALPQEEAVHELRKHCKKMRALLRLVRADIGDLYRYENAHYRTLAGGLSGSRDAVSVRDALLALAPAERFPQILEFLEARARGQADADALEEAKTLLQQGGERIGDWPLETLKWKHARRGYRRSYRRAAKTMDKAFAERSAASFHEYRKRVKDQWYHTRLLQKKCRRALRGRRKPLKNLAQALGDWRDLALLRELVGRQGTQFRGELIPLLDAADERLDTLQQEIERLSRQLFTAKKFAFNGGS
ncbi:CHAD domain-containing protein [Microbulbifer donghaiensis]|uniref:CHAD domain-containing protein n=1 Tax=Microbulbifer donghaiensis TaxID=494016 RepID=A0A1M5A8S2_9GAMM|nr:CHAD domain-containing protein [Microbulbifer donghaiensis]SHF26574.1 CHAD domain-containing protein [Microbulbifer donghaiensis]